MAIQGTRANPTPFDTLDAAIAAAAGLSVLWVVVSGQVYRIRNGVAHPA